VVTQIFAWYTEPQTASTLYGVAKRLSDAQFPTPMGQPRWNASSVRGILHNQVGGVSNVDIDGNNAFQIKAIGVVISTFETLPGMEPLWDWEGRRPLG